MKFKGLLLHLHLSTWILITLLMTFTYQVESGGLGEDSKDASQGIGDLGHGPELKEPRDNDEELDMSKIEFTTHDFSSKEVETPKGDDPIEEERLNDEEARATPLSFDETAQNLSISLNETNQNETKPARTVAFCTLISDLEEVTEATLTLSTLPVLSEDSPLLNNETGQLLESEVSSSADEYSDDGTEKDSDIPLVVGHPTVRLVNMSELVQDVLWSNNSIKSRVIQANCSVVLFYTAWCPFSAKAAPHFNALPRAFPSLRVAAIDVSAQSSVNSYFGILSVPTVILFHNGKSIAKFNESSFTLNKFAEFVHSHTDLRSDENINVTSQDFMGPLPSVPTRAVDIYLIFAWIFISACFFYYVTKSALWRRAIDLVRTTWREAEDHAHQD